MAVSEQGKRSLKGRHRGCEKHQQQQVHGGLEYLLNHNPVLLLLGIVVPALKFYACTLRTELVVEEKHHVVGV